MNIRIIHAVSRDRHLTLALLLWVTFGLAATESRGAARVSPDGLWRSVEGGAAGAGAVRPWIEPDVFRLVSLDQAELALRLGDAPLEASAAALRKKATLTIPMPDGTFARFEITESPIMAPELAAKFPEIKTYVGRGLDDGQSPLAGRGASVRLDWTPAGFHAQILTAGGATYVDPRFAGDTGLYVVYHKRDYRGPANAQSCSLLPGAVNLPQGGAARAAGIGDTLRTYRLALAATGEYTQFHGGTVGAGLAAIVTTMNRVNGIYERELAIRMVLIANNDTLVFTNAGSDPYTNSNGFAMLDENQDTMTSMIGSANYDIGHVFSTGGGGVAGLGVVCWDSGKAWGVTGQSAPVGDPFDVDFVAHEMGHQFGGNHTFNGVNGSCSGGNRHGPKAYEPGSGSTIMAYAGICGPDDLQPHSDPYFHFASLDEMRSYSTAGGGSTCSSTTSTGNSAPLVSAGVDRTIPHSTPFALTATGSDPDGEILTFGWEEADLGPSAALADPDNGSSPLFRSLDPTLSPTRVFPRLETLLADAPSDDEKLPQLARTMNFRVTARDNRAGGGAWATDTVRVIVDVEAGPFRITGPALGIVPGQNQTVTWEVAGTDVFPVNTSEVDIYLSVDGGGTFPYLLAEGTPNDGAETVLMPDVVTASARVKIEAVGNVFFAVSSRDLAAGPCTQAEPAIVDSLQVKNRFLTLAAGMPGTAVGIRVTLVDLPPPYDMFNGDSLWVGPPRDISQHGSSIDNVTGFTNFKVASLQCSPHFADFSSVGSFEVLHETIVPGALYEVQVVMETCDIDVEGSFSEATEVTTARWGDTIGVCSPGATPCTPPDGVVNVTDVLAILSTFSSAPNALAKARADLQPGCPDLIIDIADALFALTGFAGLSYQFAPGFVNPCDSPCTVP